MLFFLERFKVNQLITERDGAKRFEVANTIICKIESGKIDFKYIWLCDKADFHLQEYVLKQNWWFWECENPHHVDLQFNAQTISTKGTFGPIFKMENVTSQVYMKMLNNVVLIFVWHEQDQQSSVYIA